MHCECVLLFVSAHSKDNRSQSKEAAKTISESFGFDLMAVHFLCPQSFFWPLMLKPLTFVPDCGTNTCESNCEHMRQCGGERERKKIPKTVFVACVKNC